MKKCVKASIVIKLKKIFITLDIEGASTFDLRDEVDTENNKIAPSFPFFCIEEDEPLSDTLINTLITKMVDAPIYMWRYELDRADLSQANKLQILQGLTKFKDAARESISLTFNDVEASKCGDDCEPADEEDPDLAPLDPEDDEENIFESVDNQCYEGSVNITYTLDGETKTETYRFYYTGDGENVPEFPTLETIDDYFSNYRGTNLPPDWLDIEGATITAVEPSLLGAVFWFPVDNGCDNEPSPEPEPDDPVPAPEPSPPPSPPPAPQPKPDKVINVDLDGCDTKIVANVGLYNKLLTSLILEIGKSIIDKVFKDREVFKKFSPSSSRITKKNKDSLIWIGSTEDSSMETASSAGVIVQDNGWGIFLESAENSVDLPVGFRFSASFDLTLKFSAILNVKCGEDTKAIPVFFGHSFDSSLILPNSNSNTKVVTFNKVAQTNSRFQLADSNGKLGPILAEILTRANIEIDSDIIKSNNSLEYKDFVGTKIADSLKAVVVEIINESKKASGCDCCLESISDIKITNALFQIKDITTLGGDSIFRPELRFGDKK